MKCLRSGLLPRSEEIILFFDLNGQIKKEGTEREKGIMGEKLLLKRSGRDLKMPTLCTIQILKHFTTREKGSNKLGPNKIGCKKKCFKYYSGVLSSRRKTIGISYSLIFKATLTTGSHKHIHTDTDTQAQNKKFSTK